MKTSEKALALCHAIEAAGTSEQLTKCSVLASELKTEIESQETTITDCVRSLKRYAKELPEGHFYRVLMEGLAQELENPDMRGALKAAHLA